MLPVEPGIKTLDQEMARGRIKKFIGLFRKRGFDMAQMDVPGRVYWLRS